MTPKLVKLSSLFTMPTQRGSDAHAVSSWKHAPLVTYGMECFILMTMLCKPLPNPLFWSAPLRRSRAGSQHPFIFSGPSNQLPSSDPDLKETRQHPSTHRSPTITTHFDRSPTCLLTPYTRTCHAHINCDRLRRRCSLGGHAIFALHSHILLPDMYSFTACQRKLCCSLEVNKEMPVSAPSQHSACCQKLGGTYGSSAFLP